MAKTDVTRFDLICEACLEALHTGAQDRIALLFQEICERRQGNPFPLLELAKAFSAIDAPKAVKLYLNAAQLFYERKEYALAKACLSAGFLVDKSDTNILINLAFVYRLCNDARTGVQILQFIINKNPSDFIAHLALAQLSFPLVYRSQEELEQVRLEYSQRIDALPPVLLAIAQQDRTEHGPQIGDICNFKPFDLPYQGQCDKQLQAKLGACLIDYVGMFKRSVPFQEATSADERIRVGFVSDFMLPHSVMKTFRGWMQQLDRKRFAVHAYAVGPDNQNRIAAELSRTIEGYRAAPCPGLTWEETIRADALDVLIYLEIGMGPRSFLLAMLRLAPVQCVTWGHPETTGLPTIDYFLSSELMEPVAGDSHYTEKLVRLPNLSIWYEPLPLVGASATSRSRLGLREDSFVYACTQSLFKFLPQYDVVFPRIARLVPKAQFLFLDHPASAAATTIFKDRLSAQFDAHQLDMDRYCVFSPRLNAVSYQAMHQHVDVFLDSIGWSGCNTTLEAIAYDLPIVTLPTPLMRGRHSAAFLTRMGMEKSIPSDIDAYINFAAALAQDASMYTALRERIKRNKYLLYTDAAAIQGLEAFLVQATQGGRSQ